MQHPEKNIKGFNILELLVVLAIIGVIAAVAYPNFSDWRSSRIVKDEVQRAQTLFQLISAQVQRGQYSYVQVQVDVANDSIKLTSKGMKTSNFSDLINTNWWDENRDDRCQTTNTRASDDGTSPYWDHVGGRAADIGRVEVSQITLTKTTTDLAEGTHAICFSKTGKYHSGESGLDDEIYLTLCKRTTAFPTCIMVSGEPGSANLELVHQINWTRFGEITVDKWREPTHSKEGAWVLQ